MSPLVTNCWRLSVFGSSVSVWTGLMDYSWKDRIYNLIADGHKDELLRVWGQRVKVLGHSGNKYGQISTSGILKVMHSKVKVTASTEEAFCHRRSSSFTYVSSNYEYVSLGVWWLVGLGLYIWVRGRVELVDPWLCPTCTLVSVISSVRIIDVSVFACERARRWQTTVFQQRASLSVESVFCVRSLSRISCGLMPRTRTEPCYSFAMFSFWIFVWCL